MGFDKKVLRDLELAGLLHDIGKIATYESILDKAGRLTDKEYLQIQKHPVKGAEILSPLKQLKDIIPGIRYHHVWYNGRGYPDEGLSGENLPAFARILAVADTIDAMSADRPYRRGKSIEEVVRELKRCSGTQFDPEVVKAFLSTIR
jgi:putative nucleotidyltransferase with HDIG domain